MKKEIKRTENKWDQLAKFLENIIESANVWINVLDEKRNVVIWNKEAERISGYSKEEVLGNDKIWDMLYPENNYRKKITQKTNSIIKNDEVVENYETIIRCKNGKTKVISWHSRHIVDERGKIVGLVAIGRDITEWKKMEEELRKSKKEYKNLVENAQEAIVVIQDGFIKFANSRVMKKTGYSKKEILFRPFTEFIHPEDRDRVLQNYSKRIKGEKAPTTYSFRILTKKGEVRWAKVSPVRIVWQKRPATLNFLTDITEQKITEKKLKEALKKVRKILGAVIKVLSLVVEKKDPYTAGHQKRVSDLARAIASDMHLSEEKIEAIRTAALLHDIGKIQTPAEILTKPTKLNNIEFSLIKTHPQVAYEIIKDIEFPWNIADIILQHHERLDGSGYPQGLKDDEILLEARILAVADVVEAMSSHRPYRQALGIGKALEEIERNKGKLYSPNVVNICLKLFREKEFKFN